MLKRQKLRPDFRGDIEAKLFKALHIDSFREVQPKQIFFAYDTPDNLLHLEHAHYFFREAGCGKLIFIFFTAMIQIHLLRNLWILSTKQKNLEKVFGVSNWTHQQIETANPYAKSKGLAGFQVSGPNYSLVLQIQDLWCGGCTSIFGDKVACSWYAEK